jgi:hypothetical protein
VAGEVKWPERAPHLHEGRFWAPVPEQVNVAEMTRLAPDLRVVGPERSLTGNGALDAAIRSTYPPPPAWSIALMLGIPALMAALLGWTLGTGGAGAWPGWFPVLRRPRHG